MRTRPLAFTGLSMITCEPNSTSSEFSTTLANDRRSFLSRDYLGLTRREEPILCRCHGRPRGHVVVIECPRHLVVENVRAEAYATIPPFLLYSTGELASIFS